ncbi:MAG: phosphoserine phosphatase SerB [Nitrososphaerota archaeon]|nr:phosphoserine phosphatase SerB [Nitrososphaerota archaeon]
MIVIFDVEGVLVDGEFLPDLARLVHREEEVRDITMKGIRGEISWERGLAERVELVKGVTHQQCVRVANSLPIMKGAVEATEKLKKLGCIMVGVSGGFSLLTNRVKSELGLDHVFSNELVFHDGRLVGYGLLVNANKAQILTTAFGNMFSGMKKMAVVDGANDIDLFDLADLRVAFNAQEIVKRRADSRVEIRDLRPVVDLARGLIEKEAAGGPGAPARPARTDSNPGLRAAS